jgi:hypothetical protein
MGQPLAPCKVEKHKAFIDDGRLHARVVQRDAKPDTMPRTALEKRGRLLGLCHPLPALRYSSLQWWRFWAVNSSNAV